MSRENGDEEQPVDKTGDASALKSASEIALERSAAGNEPSATTADVPQKEIEELRAQAAKAQEHWDRLLRTQADLENYRKRVTRERQELIRASNEKLLRELLVPIDHFEMGLQSTPKNSPEDPLRQGMEMVLTQFQQFLKSQGITDLETAGQMFDPSLHEAVVHQESDLPEGQIIQQLRKGYRTNDRLLRPARVVVSKGPSEPNKAAPEDLSNEQV